MSPAAASKALDCNRVFGDEYEVIPSLPNSRSPALRFQVKARDSKEARAAQLKLPHFLCETPMFMPVGTKGVILSLYALPRHATVRPDIDLH
jgi:hypothetical protein